MPVTDVLSSRILHVSTLCAQGKHAEALQAVMASLAELPDNVELLVLYGNLLVQTSQPIRAEECFRRILMLEPRRADICNRLAAVLLSLRRYREAEEVCRRALALSADNAEIHANLGNILSAQGRLEDAESCYRRAMDIAPGFTGVYLNLGNLLKIQRKFDAAADCYRKVLQLDPGFLKMYIGLAECSLGAGQQKSALEYYNQALAIDPGFVDAHLNRSCVCALLGRNDEALASLGRLLRLEPRHFTAHYNCGLINKKLGEFDLAASSYRMALSIRPDDRDVQLSLGLLELLRGNYTQGWHLYSARKSIREKGVDSLLRLPGDLRGCRILVVKDQGLGDEIFFLRFARELHERGAWVAYRTDPKIKSIVNRLAYLDCVIDEGEPPGAVDITISVGDLPYALGYDDQKMIPSPARFTALPERIESAYEMLAAVGPRPWIGITWWAGTKGPESALGDRLAFREIPLNLLIESLRGLAGTIILLQRKPDKRESRMLTDRLGCPVMDASYMNDDLESMLGMLALLDDYIGVDNTNMHLSAGVGKPCRILVPHPPEWRMQTVGQQSPWFPGFNLYRQNPGDDWGPALEALHADIVSEHVSRISGGA